MFILSIKLNQRHELFTNVKLAIPFLSKSNVRHRHQMYGHIFPRDTTRSIDAFTVTARRRSLYDDVQLALDLGPVRVPPPSSRFLCASSDRDRRRPLKSLSD